MRTIHLVSHTHWDREWYRTFQHFRLKLVHLIDGLLDLLDDDRNYKFFMLDGQTIVLKDYLMMRPENEARLRHYIRDGHIAIGPFHILPDEFLVSPEATVRNLLQGKRTCKHFGAIMQVGYIPDPFGHIGQMPQILHGFGIHTACVQRGLSDESCEFWWEAPNGARVLMAYLRDGYGNAAGLPVNDPEHFASEVNRLRDSLLPHSSSGKHLLLMHGTDHMEPPPHTSTAISATQGQLGGDLLVHSTLTNYMKSIQTTLRHESLPTIRGELRDCKRSHLLPGVLSTRMWIKQRNRACETLLEKWAEPFSTFASNLNALHCMGESLKNPAQILRQAWCLLMECHPHDSICGCSIDQVHDEMKTRFDQVEQIGEEITRQSLDGLVNIINTESDSQGGTNQAIVVFNPHSFTRTDNVEVSIECKNEFDLVDENCNIIPYQSKGMGSKELIHANLRPKELQGMYTAVHDGRVMGLSILDVNLSRQGETVHLNATVSEKQPANLHAWQQAVGDLEALIADPNIKYFRVRAISSDITKIFFTASNVPGFGWKTYYVKPLPNQENAVIHLPKIARLFLPLARIRGMQNILATKKKHNVKHRIETDLLAVEAERDGSLTVTDNATGRKWYGLNLFKDGGDCGDEYNYCPPKHDQIITGHLKNISIEDHDLQQSIILELELFAPDGLSPNRTMRSGKKVPVQIITRATIYQNVKRVDINTKIFNNVSDHRLRVHFQAPFVVESAQYDGHFEVVERNIELPEFDQRWVEHPRPEVPQRTFTSIHKNNLRLTIANRGLPEVEVLKNQIGGSEIALTLLRCVGWLSRDDFANRNGHAGPFLETPGAQMRGEWEFQYAIIFEQDELSAFQQAYGFESNLKAVSTNLHNGSLPSCGSFLQVSPGEFLISTIKEAERGKGWVTRGYNLGDTDLRITLQTEIPTKSTTLVNLAEKKIINTRPSKGGRISKTVKGHEIITVMFQN